MMKFQSAGELQFINLFHLVAMEDEAFDLRVHRRLRVGVLGKTKKVATKAYSL